MNGGNDVCFKHGKSYQLIGNDDRCEQNCQICFDCLRGIDNGHRKGVSNHETISIQQLMLHFKQLQRNNQQEIVQCQELIDQYFGSLQTLLQQELIRERKRLQKIIRKIMLKGITRDQRKFETILALSNGQFSNLKCQQVGEVIDEVYNFESKNNSQDFNKFIQYMINKENDVMTDFRDIVQSKAWSKTVLKNIESDVSFSRLKTEEDSPKKTLRKSVRKQIKRPDLSQIKKPLELVGSKLIEGRQQSQFMAKLFDHRHVHSSQLLFRASQYNFSIKDFHRLCDNENNTLVLVKTEFNKIIGGFTPLPWKSTANTLHSDVRKESFMFSVSLKQKMSLIDEKSAIFNSVNFGPTFGAGADLAICHNGNVQKTSYSQFPYSYANSRYKQSNQHSTALFSGQKNGNHFLLKEWEVWKVIFAE